MVVLDNPLLGEGAGMLPEPGVASDLADGVSPIGIDVQDFLEEIGSIVAHKLRDLEFAADDFFVEDLSILFVEWKVPAEHREEDDAAGPDIDF